MFGMIIKGDTQSMVTHDVFVKVKCQLLSHCESVLNSDMQKGQSAMHSKHLRWQAEMNAVHVQGYLHYMPYVDGAYTKAALDLKRNVRWIAFWKGRQIPFADITAL